MKKIPMCVPAFLTNSRLFLFFFCGEARGNVQCYSLHYLLLGAPRALINIIKAG